MAKKRQIPYTASVFLMTILLMAGCSLDYDQNMISDSMSESIPDTVLISFTHTVVRNGKAVFVITAEKAEAFSKKNRTLLTDVDFKEFDNDGKVTTKGRADHAVFYTDTENADLSGNLDFYSASENGGVTGDHLYWDSEKKVLNGDPDETVMLNKDSGSRLEGKGFEADFRYRTLSFDKDVKGSYQTEGDEK